MGQLQVHILHLKLITQVHNGKVRNRKKSKAISDRSGLQFPYREMVREWNGSFVHISEFEPKQPQLEPKPMNGDAISLRHVRPDRTEPAVPKLLPVNPFTITNASTTVTVNEPNHGRSSGQTVRFRDATNVVNLPAATINLAAGYTITKVNDNSYTFVSGVTASRRHKKEEGVLLLQVQ